MTRKSLSVEAAPKTRDLLVSEVFGPTFQGEGQHAGRLASFIRLGGCNLHCSWCDTPYTWAFDERHAKMHSEGKQYDPKEQLRRMSVSDVLLELPHRIGCLVISGGEPLLQRDSVHSLVQTVWATGEVTCIEIETAGTQMPLQVDVPGLRYNVSPKLQHSGNEKDLRYKPEVLTAFARLPATTFKFVVQRPEDLLEVATIIHNCYINDRQVFIMPEGRSTEVQLKRMKELAPHILELGWNITPRLHVMLWEDERGR
jgi:7-carboxy-7-deazaguanine synthase